MKGVLTRLRKTDSFVIRTGSNFTYTYTIYQDNINIQSSYSKGETQIVIFSTIYYDLYWK